MCGVCGVGGGGDVTSPPRERKYIQTDLFVDLEFLVLCWSFLGAEGVGGYAFFLGGGGRREGGKLQGEEDLCGT